MKNDNEGRIQICISLYERDLQDLDQIRENYYPEMSRSQIIRLAVCNMLYELDNGEVTP